MSKSTHNFLDRCRVVLDTSQQICVKEVHTSGCFYLQLLETDDAYKLDEMYSRLDRETGRLPWKKYTPRLGEIILSYSTVRAALCRSEVVSLLGCYNQVRVFHVDYGSYESISLSHVISLPSHALQPTRQAVKCCLSDATCLTQEGLDTLRALSLEKELEGKLQWSYDLICYYVSLMQQSGKSSIGELLIAQGMATPLVKCNVLEPGLECSCHMSTVISPSELYFHFSSDLQTLKELQEMINSSRLSPFKSMAPLSDKLTREGAYCLIQNPADLLKYRARVTCVRPSDRTAQVHLVDFGHKINVTYEQMFSMTPDTADQTALCFASSLTLRPHSHAWGLEVRERLLALGQKYRMNFEVCVKNRIGTVHWLQVFTPDRNEPIEDSLSDLCVPENNYYLSMYRSPYGLNLDDNDSETVCITHVVDWNKFYVQLTKHSGELDWLTERLADSFSDTELDEQWLRSPTEGVLCAAPYYEANTWARAVVTSVPHSTTDKVQLFYIDYGNKDEVLPYDLKIIPTFAMHHPAMAIECGLYSTKLMPTYNLEEFRCLVAEKALFMTVHESTAGRYLVSLVDKMAGGADILESLELRSLSPPSPSPSPTCTSPPLSPVAIPMRSLPLNNIVNVMCTLADSPNYFKCQLLSRTETSLSSLSHTLQRLARDTATRLNTRDIKLGMPVIALNTEDRLWYRAVILEKEQRGFIVDLVDFGNKIKIQAHEMTHLPVQLIGIPAFGITCKINLDIPQKWSQEDCDIFRSIILGKTFKAVLKSVQKRLYGIDICEKEIIAKLRSIGIDTKILKKHNYGPKRFLNSLKLKPGSKSRVLISHIENPARFFCQLEENVPFYEEFQQRLSQTVISPEQRYFEEGDYCIALYIMGNTFHRAKILSADYTHQTADILYVDHGNREIASFDSLRIIPEEFTQLPMQAICCSLRGVHPIGTLEEGGWHSGSKPLMENFLDSENILIQFQEVESDNFHLSKATVEVLEPPGLIEKLVNEGFAITTRKQDIPTYCVPEGSTIKVVVSHMTPDHLVYCIPSAHGSVIDQLVANLKSCESHSPLLSPRLGGVVAARSPASGLWNRARILSRVGKLKFEVFNIDIGTKESVDASSIRHIPVYAAAIQCQTFPCTIPQLDDYITSPKYVEVFRGLAGGGTLLCEVSGVAVDGLHNISLKLPGGEDLVDELVNQGALFKKYTASHDTTYAPYSSIPARPGEGYPLPIQNIPTVVSQMSISLQSTCDVIVSHLDNPGNFYVQFANSHAQLQFLSDQINQHYSSLTEMELSKITPKTIVLGAVCCTRFAQDTLWYRGKVLEINQNEVTVQYVDYGNTETKGISEIKLMHPSFYTLPGQAIKCSLVEVAAKQDEWTMEASQLFQSLTFNKLLQCTFLNKSEDGIFLVSLIDSQSNLNIAQILLNSRYAKSAQSPVAEKKAILDLDIKVNAQESVYISDIKTPENFHLHLSSYENNLNQFMDQITSYHNRLQPDISVKTPVVGDVYCVKFLDQNWYRGIVREIKGNNLLVYMVDYGNLFNVSLKDSRELHESFYTFPKHSIECCLHDVTLGATYTDWLPAAINFFKAQTEKQQLFAKFIQKNSEGRWEVTLTKGTRDIGKLICESGMAISKSFAARYAPQASLDGFSPTATTPTHSITNDVQSHSFPSNQQAPQYGSRSPRKVKELILPRGHVCEAYISYAVSPTDFSIQLTELSDKLDALMEELARHCERSYNEQVTRASPNLLVAAKFTEDDKWYRAIITNIDTPGIVKVHYIDYGNKENLDMGRIRPLPNQLTGLQAQSIRCSLRGFSKETRFSPELMDQFKHTVTDRFFTLQVLNFHSTYYEVDLVDNTSTQSMAAVFLSKSSGNTQVFVGELKPLILSEGTELTAQLCVMHSPTDFYMQVAETSEALNSMEFELNRTSVAGKAPKSFELKVGVPCAACYSTSGTWYRAKVLAVSSPKIHVLYVDYGNDEWLLNEKIQPLPQKFLSLPCQAFRCAIRSQQSRYIDDDVDKFREKLTSARDIRVKIIGHHDQYIYLVELYSHQTNEALKFTYSKPVIYPTLQIPAGTVDRFKVCHILPNGTFYLQRDSAESTLNSISAELVSYASRMQLGMKPEDLQPGLPCAVKFYQDSNWYRGKVLRTPQQQQVEILFVDYGNDDVISLQTLLPIPDAHIILPAQAIQALLQSTEQGTKPSIRELENFQARTHEQVLKVNIIWKNNDIHIVRMFFSNDEEIFLTGSGSKPPGFRKGRPGEENLSPNESSSGSRSGGKFENTRLNSAPQPREPRWRGRDDDGESGQRGNSDSRERSEGGFKNRGEGGYGRRSDREGGFSGRSDREGGSGGRSEREGGFGGRSEREGGFSGRSDKEGGFSGRSERGGFGGRSDREGGSGGRSERGGFGGRSEREGGSGGRSEREGGSGGRSDREGGFGGRSGREGGYRDREDRGDRGSSDRNQRGDQKFESRERGERSNRPYTSEHGERRDRGEGWNRSSGGSEKSVKFGDQDRDNKFEKTTDAWKGSEDIRLKSDVLGTQGWAKNAESQPETVHWDTKPEAKPTDSFIEERLVINQAYEVYVSYIVSSKEFYCSLIHKSDNLEAVMKKLSSLGAAKALTAVTAEAVQPGKAVVSVYSEDSCLYRAKVLTPSQAGSVEVQYVDYGNSEKVPVVNLKTIPTELLELPSQAIPCMLPQQVEKFRENIEAHESVKIKVTNVDGEKTTVDVFTTDGKIIYKMKPSPVGKKMEVYFSHVVSPYEFYCQSTTTNTLDTINTLLADFTNTTQLERQEMQLGHMCLGVYSLDSALYRSIIMQIIDPKSKVLVQFMDYGNSEVIHPSKIYQMPSNISSFPTQAYKCAVVHPTYKIAEEKVAQFVQQMNGLEKVVIDVKEAALNQYLLVEILDTSGKPIPLPFAVPTSTSIADPPIYPPGAGIKCGISHIVNPSEFYCQNLSIINTLEKLMKNIDSDIRNNLLAKLKSYEVGTQCIAQYSGNSGWYRGVIASQADAHTYQVLYIDYGNSGVVSNKNMYSPKPDYLAIPPCAFQCSIVVEKPMDGWSEKLTTEFSNKTKNTVIILQVVEVTADKKYKVKLLDEFGIEEIALPEIKHTPVIQDIEKYDPILLPENPTNVYISSINSVHLFYIQQSNCEENLATLMAKTHQVCTSGTCTIPDSWFVDMICFAKFSDGVWYRSRIEQITDDQVRVNYIDYGNSEFVSKTDVLSINKDLVQMPFALPCRFAAGYGLKSTPEIEAKFAEYETEPLALIVVEKSLDGVFECQLTTQVDSTDDPVDIGNELAELLSEEVRCNEIVSYCERTATSLTQRALATAISILSEPRSYHFQRGSLPVASTHSVYLTQTDAKLGLLYIQLEDSDAAIQELMQSVAQFCADTVNAVKLESYRVGTPCLTKFTEDNVWYRAEVTETFLEFDHVKVLFLDYGNTQVSHIDSVIRISPDLLKVPVYGYLCKFDACYLIPEGFDISSTLSDYEMESLLEIEVTRVESCVHYVKLTDSSTGESQDIGQVISNQVPYDHKQALLSDIQTSFVNKLVDDLIQQTISQLDKEKKHTETSLLLDSYVNEYVECIVQTSQSKLELEEDTAINQLVNDVINVSTNHVVRIHQGYKTQPLVHNTSISVNLSHIVSTQCFYVQVLSQAVDLFQVTEEVESYCSDSANTAALNCVEVDLPVLAVFSQDGAWYRGIVTAVCDVINTFKVLFVDFGNSDDVPGHLICHLPDPLLSKVSFSYQCRLSSEYKLKDDASAVAKFTELTEMKTDLLMEVIGFSEGVYEVRLFEGTEGEVGILMNTLPFFYPDPNDPPHPVTLTCFHSHQSFYLQTQPNQDSLQYLQMQMLDYCNSSSAGTAVQMDQLFPGTLVLVLLNETQSWARAKILANSEFSKETQVQLIDYGSILQVSTYQIRLLSPSSPITTLPPIAFHCRLPAHYSILPCGPVSEEFVKPRVATATFNGPLPPNNQFEAEVFDGEQRLALSLEKLSDPYRKWQYVFPPVNTLKNVFISSIESVLHFYVQESGSEVVLSNLMEKVTNFCLSTTPIAPLTKEGLCVGMAVLAVFSEDQQWYRSRIEKIDHTIQVRFVDYGNTDSVPVTQMRHVPYELLCIPPLAYPCRFNSEIGLVSGLEIEQSFQTLIGDVELILRVLSTAQEHIEVELNKPTQPDRDIGKTLYFELPKEVRTKLLGEDVKESIFDGNTTEKVDQTDSISSDSVYKLTLPPINSTIKGVASNITSIQNLYIQDNEITMDLVRLAQLTPATADLIVAPHLTVDNMVLAKFSGDAEIYRAKIIGIGETLVDVFFIDYGNSDSVPKTDVYEIQNEQKAFPCYALPSCLDCDLPVSELTTEKLTETLEDKDLEVFIKGHKDNNRLVVDIRLENGECVLDILKEIINNEKPESEQYKPELEKSPKKLCKPIDTPVISNHPDLPPDIAAFPELDLETEDGNKFEATLTHSNNLSSFYLQKKSSEDQVNELMEKLLTHCGSTTDTPPTDVLPGMAVIAMLDVDGSWYRGQIVEQKEDSYSVFSVDYGNIETMSADQILPIALEFLQAPFAYPCKLYLANNNSLPENAFDTFTYLMEDTSCQIEVMSVEDNTLEVKITVKEGDVFTQLFMPSNDKP